VVFDVHEDVPSSIRNRDYLPRPLRPVVAAGYRLVERLCLPFVSGLTLADEAYGRYYRSRRTLVARNYPLGTYTDLYRPRRRAPGWRPTLVYTGALTRLRGVMEMLELTGRLRSRFPALRLRLVGPMGPDGEAEAVPARVEELDLADHVELTGLVSHADVHRHILDADVGLALLHPDPNYLRSLPTKLFEYMMMGRPAVVSHFPMWRQIVEEAGCGRAVDPLDLARVEAAVAGILECEERAAEMGRRGRRAVLEKYSWEAEAKELVRFYRQLLTP
jgi:glycosyltransferase involved in cell wall biosynthesis